ncbi:MAG TPA: YhdP family protein [Methylotenera sp.]|nr:YhdP family protein [Methylotenera sp.]HPH04382.1 YhdP family protein [Methylotenera sp.]HPM99936.1 YhdP family protein [Methylotenera sp.]
MVKKSLSLVYRIAKWLIIACILIVLVVALGIHFYVFPHINEYKNKIASYASVAAKQKVEIGNIQADWLGFNPHLTVANIVIYDAENRPALQLNNTDATFSWLSIPKLEPHLAAFTIRAPELTIRRNIHGKIFIAGINTEGESKPDLPNWLLRQTQFDVQNAKVVWLDELRNAPPISLNNLNLQVQSPPWASLLKKHRISFSALPSAGTNHPVNISANVYGNDVSKIAQWRGEAQAHLKDADIAAFKAWIDYPALTHPMNLLAGNGSADVHLQFAEQKIQALDGEIALENVKIQLRSKAEPVELNKVAGKLGWLGTENSQKLSVENLTLNANNGLTIDGVNGNFSETATGKRSLNFKLNQLDLALVQPYLLQLPIPAEPLQRLSQLAPKGKLEKLSFSWAGDKTATSSYKISSVFNGLSIAAHDKIPGFSNLTGLISADQNAGKITLYSTNSFLDFKNILRWPIPADKLDGDITWSVNDKNIKIQTSHLAISNAHLAGTLNASYLIDGVKGGMLDLSAKFGNGNAKFAPFYYPIILGEKTTQWLDSSILSGKAEDIQLTVKGRLADFPYVNTRNNQPDPKLGLFRVSANISSGELEFGKNWPKIEGIALKLLFEGKRMELNAQAGHLLGNKIQQAKVAIAQLDSHSPILEIDGIVNGDIKDGIQFVNKSPVALVTQGFTEDLKASGQGKLTLNVKIPLHNIEASQYKGAYQISNGNMASDNIPTLSNINGILAFTESSFTAQNLNANAFGAPVILAINSNKDKSVHVTAKGKMNDAAIKQALTSVTADVPSLTKVANYFTGSTDWIGDIVIQKPNVNINIQSDLAGISSNLPAPFNKGANEKLSLNVENKQTPNSNALVITLGNKLAANMVMTGQQGQLAFNRGNIQINASANPTSLNSKFDNNSKGLQITGNLDYLDADAWRKVVQEVIGETKSNKASTIAINKMVIDIKTLDIFDKRINDLTLSHSTNKDGLSASIKSRELAGDIQWVSQGNGKLVARLSHLTVPDATPNRVKQGNIDSQNIIKKETQDYPALDITANSFTVNKKQLGALELVAFPQGDNWNIEKLKLSTPDSVLTANGQWNNWTKNPNTFLNITWDIKNLGKTLNGVGYPETIKGGEGTLNAQLHWPGSPTQFNPKGLNGDLQLDLKKGQFLKVQPGVGRLLGLLSLQSLPRRLTLDFRDLFSNGFAFDSITGTAKISQGIMRSDNFAMSGPAADVAIKGETNLQTETQHLNVKVLPHVSDSLSLAALAGGPLAGAVAFLAQKILKDPLNKIASSEYEIIGTWDNPQEANAPKANTESTQQSPLQQK